LPSEGVVEFLYALFLFANGGSLSQLIWECIEDNPLKGFPQNFLPEGKTVGNAIDTFYGSSKGERKI